MSSVGVIVPATRGRTLAEMLGVFRKLAGDEPGAGRGAGPGRDAYAAAACIDAAPAAGDGAEEKTARPSEVHADVCGGGSPR